MFLAIHIVTVVSDSFAPIRWIDVFVPFISAYRPFWLGLGAVALDLLLALVITSLMRHRLGYRTWRAVHWLAYVCWPVAALHGLGTGSDTQSGPILAFTAVCVLAVLVAGALRVGAGLRTHRGARSFGFGVVALAPLLLVAWLVSGPLASGWARKAGTPGTVLAASSNEAAALAPTTTPTSTAAFPSAGFDATARGTLHESAPDATGKVVVSLVGTLSEGANGQVDVELTGKPLANGGVSMTSGTVTLSDGSQSYRGAVVGLGNSQIVADMPGPDGAQWQVVIDVTQLDEQRGVMTADVHVAPSRSDRGGRDDEGGAG